MNTTDLLLDSLQADAPVRQVLVGAFWTAVALDGDQLEERRRELSGQIHRERERRTIGVRVVGGDQGGGRQDTQDEERGRAQAPASRPQRQQQEHGNEHAIRVPHQAGEAQDEPRGEKPAPAPQQAVERS